MTDNLLSGKVALVTGAGRGIGKSIAMTLARNGALVGLVARSDDELQSVKTEIEQAGGSASCFPVDVANEAEVQKFVAGAVEELGGVDILVNNAGIGEYAVLADTTTEQWDRMMAVNARGPFILCRECIPHMKKKDIGWIVNISSVVGHKGYVNQSAYGASKHALMGMTKALAKELQPDNIRVHAISPGGVDTEMVGNARPDLDRSVLINPQEVADAVLFLVLQNGNAVIDEIRIRRFASEPF